MYVDIASHTHTHTHTHTSAECDIRFDERDYDPLDDLCACV